MEWRGLRAEWQADYDREHEQRAWKARLEELQAEYQAVYAAYWQEYQHVLAENRVRLHELQKDLDGQFTFWRLEYAAIALDDETGERFVDTAHVNVTHATPDADGWWYVFDYGKLARRRFTHVVSVEGPLLCPDSADLRGALRVAAPDGGYVGELRYNPAAIGQADVVDMANTIQLAYPDEPEPPDGLADYYAADARRKATQKDELLY
jgi:hypothetical protein